MTLSDKYKLRICYSQNGWDFVLEKPFIPLMEKYIDSDDYTPFHNNKLYRGNDLRVFLDTTFVPLTISNLMHFDLSDFTLPSGVYNPNTGDHQLGNSNTVLNNKIATPARVPALSYSRIGDRDRNTQNAIISKPYYALLYLEEI